MTHPGGNSITAGTLTRHEMDVMRFLCGYRDARGISPTLREIAAAIGMSKSATWVRLQRLEAAGAIRRLRRRRQAIDVVRPCPVPRAPDGAALHFIPVGRLVFHEGHNA